MRAFYALPAALAAALALTACSHPSATATGGGTAAPDPSTPITLAYSEWPGWTAWDIVDQKGFFKKHNVNVKLVWFPVYTDELNAVASGQVDGGCMAMSEALGPMAQGQPVKVVLVNDNSAGNDGIVARAGINSVKDLRGKNVAAELGTVEQYLLDKALALNGMTEKDIHYINVKGDQSPAAMISGKIDACAVWEPVKSKMLAQMAGTKQIFTSRQMPGLIPDLLVMKQQTVAQRPKDMQNIVDAWYDMMGWWRAHPDEAIAILAKHSNTPVPLYKQFVMGTRIFDAKEDVAAFTQSAKPTSLYASAPPIAQFLVGQKQLPKVPDFAASLDPEFVKASASQGLGTQPPYAYALKVD